MYPSRERFRGSSPPRGIELTEPKVTVEYLQEQVSNVTLDNNKDFHQFSRLPGELKLKIWEYTLPDFAMIRTTQTWEGSTTLWPVIDLPKALVPGKIYGVIPAIPLFPDPEDHPVALKVCHDSRTVALKQMFPLNDAVSRQKKGKWYDYISRNDIVDLEIGKQVIRSLGGPKQPFRSMTTALKKGERGLRFNFPNCAIDDDIPLIPNPLFDFGSRKYTILYALPEIATSYCMGSTIPSDYHLRKGYVGLRLSEIERYILGTEITIGSVPECLAYHGPKDPWSRYEKVDSGQDRLYNLHPSHILYIYSHILHELAFGLYSDCSRNSQFDLWNKPARYMRDIFEALMLGEECPGCKQAVLPRIRELYGDAIELDKMSIVVLTSRTLLERIEGHWENVGGKEPFDSRCEGM